MAFTCPKCLKSGSLAIEIAIEMPPDGRSDEITLQALVCSSCDFRGLAVYQESRRGALDSVAWEHIGYRVGPLVVESVAGAIRSCPEPRNSRCSCAAHRRFATQDRNSIWQLPAEMAGSEVFPMHLA